MKRKMACGLAVLGIVALAGSNGWAKGFDNDDVKGTYVESFDGDQGNPPGAEEPNGHIPVAGVGIETADGHGNISGTVNQNVNGTPCEGTIAGTYTVNTDGSGSSSVVFTPSTGFSGTLCQKATNNFGFAIVSHKQIDFYTTNPDSVIHGVAKKQE